MKQTINSFETLEGVVSIPEFPPMIKDLFTLTTSVHERNETTLVTSLKAPSSYALWNAALLAINPIVNFSDGSSKSFQEASSNKSSFKKMESLTLEIGENDFLEFEKIANTPQDIPIISVFGYIKKEGSKIDEIRFSATGVSKKPFVSIECVSELKGKVLDHALIATVKEQVVEELKPSSNHLASAKYRKEMAALLIERLLEKYLHGE